MGIRRRADDRRASVVPLSEEAHDPDRFDKGLTKAEASKRIDALKAKIEREREWAPR